MTRPKNNGSQRFFSPTYSIILALVCTINKLIKRQRVHNSYKLISCEKSSGDREMELNQNREAKQGPATVFPVKKTLVKKKMLDQVVQIVTSCSGQCARSCSGTSQSSKSCKCSASTEVVVQPPKTKK